MWKVKVNNKIKYKGIIRKFCSFFLSFALILTLFNNFLIKTKPTYAEDVISTITKLDDNTIVTQEGCNIYIKTTQNTSWSVPRKPIDLVVLQDASGSFRNTISSVKNALKELTTPVKPTEYNPEKPRLVFTDNPETSDRVMLASFQGLDGSLTYDKWHYKGYTDEYNVPRGYAYGYETEYIRDTKFTGDSHYASYNDAGYRLNTTNLIKDKNSLHNFINNIITEGGTPTVPAIDDLIARYKAAVEATDEKMKNDRKTVFLIITDGVANGVRKEVINKETGAKEDKVVIEYSGKRMDQLEKAWGIDSRWDYMEASQNILARSNELTQAGTKLKQVVGDKGSVVVGFWEDVTPFTAYTQYGPAYLGGYSGTDVDLGGDGRSVQEMFSSALRSVASADKEVNGKQATFYVNEQKDINKFSNGVLAAVGNALVKENVQGEFKITKGYKVKTVSINEKQIVSEVTDEKTQIRGKITQNGEDVTISVPDAAFNPGDNKFDYELLKIEGASESGNEEDEVAPDDDYKPGTEEREVGQLVGHFRVGNYKTSEIGSKEEKKVKINSLKYCYPNVVKKITDKNKSNDKGAITPDPILNTRSSYVANLDDVHEEFEYTVDYRMNNIALNIEKNPMLVDPINYRLKVLEAYVTDTTTGERLNNFNIRQIQKNDVQTGKERTYVVADIPEAKGVNTDTVKEGKYGKHKFKRYTLHIKARFKDEYPFEKSQKEYIKILQENDGYGVANQAFIKWNGETNDPTDETAQVRRSNNVFVTPPVETNIEKKVRGEGEDEKKGTEHYNLPQLNSKFIYDIKVAWPGLADSYSIEDELKPELEVTKDDVVVKVNGKEISDLKNHITVENNLVKLSLAKSEITSSLNRKIRVANKDNLGPALIHLEIKAKVKEGANLDKYKDDYGVVKIPNDSTVKLNDTTKKSNVVTVTPDEPAISKKINDNLTHLDINSWEKDVNKYTYNVRTVLPGNIKNYIKYEIKDTLDERLETISDNKPYIKGDAAKYFDISYDEASRTITAKVKADNYKNLMAGSIVELVIPAKVKDGVTDANIPNQASVFYNKQGDDGKPKETPKTPPVTVTPPPTTPTKKINDTLDDLVIKTPDENAYNYNIKTKLPGNITEYKVFGIKDKLDSRFELQKDQKAYVKGDLAKYFEVSHDESTNTIIAKIKDGEFLNLKGGAEVELVIPAKVKDGVADAKIPNEATVIYNTTDINGTPKETPKTPPVTVTPPPTTPIITKKINEKDHKQLENIKDEFNYEITTQIPKNANKFEITDKLENVLEFASEVEVKVDQGNTNAQITKEDGLLTVNFTQEELKEKAGKSVVVKFKAKIKENADLTDYTKEGSTKIPNKAKYVINNNPKLEKETPPVTVTPPPTTPYILKKVNERENIELEKQNEIFTYKVETKVPKDAENFEISDTIKDVLEFTDIDGVKATVDGEKIDNVKVEGKQLTVTLSKEQVQQKADKEVRVEFKAKLKEGLTQQELNEYKVEGQIKIPNKASYRINLSDDPKLKKESNPVTVTPPPTTPDIIKKVSGVENLNLETQADEVTYTIDTKVPENATTFSISDNLDSVLEYSGKIKAIVDGKYVKDEQIKIENQLLTITLSEEEAEKAGKDVHVEFKAKLRADANLANYIVEGTIKVPNQAKYRINNNPKFDKDSNKVHITPPPTTSSIEKKVEDAYQYNLETEKQEFTYTIDTKVPANATSYEVRDKLEAVLQFAGDVKATLDGNFLDNTHITKDDVEGRLKVTLTEQEAINNGDKVLHIEFKAKIKDNVNLNNYRTKEGIKVPNKASYRVNNKPEIESNTVTVTPPPTTPTISKKVNDKEHEELKNFEDEFTYKIATQIPRNANRFQITDTIEKAIELVGEVNVTLDGKKVEASISKNENLLSVELGEGSIKNNAGAEVLVEFKAKIRQNADLEEYKDKNYEIPNKAKYIIDNNPKFEKETPPVTVTPPTVKLSPPPVQELLPNAPLITKKVNGEEQANLKNKGEVFTYTINTEVPKNAHEFKIKDTLEEVLEFEGEAVAKLAGKTLSKEQITVEGQQLALTLNEEQLTKVGKKVELEFKAKIRENANLTKYKNAEEVRVPNKASYIINNLPEIESNIVTVTPPQPPKPVEPPKPIPPQPGEKSINSVDGNENETLRTLKTITENFRYDIKQKLGVNTSYEQFAISDELEDVLEIEKVTVGISGEEIVRKDAEELKEKIAILEELAKVKENNLINSSGKDELVEKLSFNKEKISNLREKLTAIKENSEKEKLKLEIETLEKMNKELSRKLASLNTEKSNEESITQLKSDLKTLKEQLSELENSKEAEAIKLLNKVLSSRNIKNEVSQKELELLGTLSVKDNIVKFEVTNKEILRLLENREVKLSIYAKIRDNIDLSKYIDKETNLVQIPNEAKIIFDNNPKITNKVLVTPPPKTPEKPTPKMPPKSQTPPPPTTPPEPKVPEEPKNIPPTPEVPKEPKEFPKEPKKDIPKDKGSLAKTGEENFDTTLLGVLGLLMIVCRKKIFSNEK